MWTKKIFHFIADLWVFSNHFGWVSIELTINTWSLTCSNITPRLQFLDLIFWFGGGISIIFWCAYLRPVLTLFTIILLSGWLDLTLNRRPSIKCVHPTWSSALLLKIQHLLRPRQQTLIHPCPTQLNCAPVWFHYLLIRFVGVLGDFMIWGIHPHLRVLYLRIICKVSQCYLALVLFGLLILMVSQVDMVLLHLMAVIVCVKDSPYLLAPALNRCWFQSEGKVWLFCLSHDLLDLMDVLLKRGIWGLVRSIVLLCINVLLEIWDLTWGLFHFII